MFSGAVLIGRGLDSLSCSGFSELLTARSFATLEVSCVVIKVQANRTTRRSDKCPGRLVLPGHFVFPYCLLGLDQRHSKPWSDKGSEQAGALNGRRAAAVFSILRGGLLKRRGDFALDCKPVCHT